jgi:hypothetical protein
MTTMTWLSKKIMITSNPFLKLYNESNQSKRNSGLPIALPIDYIMTLLHKIQEYLQTHFWQVDLTFGIPNVGIPANCSYS